MGNVIGGGKGRTPKSNRLSFTIETNFMSLDLIRDEWDEFMAYFDAGVYFSYDWCKIWWEYYSYKRKMKVFLFRVDGKIVGIVPIVIDIIWLGVIRVSLGKLLGSDSTVSVLRVPVEEEYAGEVYDFILDELFGCEKVDLVWFGKICGDDKSLSELRKVECGMKKLRIVYDSKGECHTAFNLPDSFEKYLGNISKSKRRDFRQGINRMKKSFDFNCSMIDEPSCLKSEFEKFIVLHEKQWLHEKKLGHFGDWPKSIKFHKELVNTFSKKGLVRITKISVDKKDIALQYCLIFGQKNHWLLPAREPGVEWNRFQLGTVMLGHMIEDSIGAKITMIDGGQGRYDYKVKMGASEYPLQSVLLGRCSLLGRLKSSLFVWFSKMLEKGYYKIWFCRLMPKSPRMFRRPLWKIWIRTRI